MPIVSIYPQTAQLSYHKLEFLGRRALLGCHICWLRQLRFYSWRINRLSNIYRRTFSSIQRNTISKVIGFFITSFRPRKLKRKIYGLFFISIFIRLGLIIPIINLIIFRLGCYAISIEKNRILPLEIHYLMIFPELFFPKVPSPLKYLPQ